MSIKTTILFLALVGIASPSAWAAGTTYTWNATLGDWSNSSNWTPSGTPTSADTAIISNSGTANFGTTALSLTGTAATIYVGDGGNGTGTGTLDISGTGTALSTTKGSFIGAANGANGGSGTVILENGATWTNIGAALVVGGGVAAGATGTATGTLEVESGADLNMSTANFNLSVGREAGGNGTVIVDGGSIEVGSTGTGVIYLATKVSGTGGTTSAATLTLDSGSITATGKNGATANAGISTDQGTSTINLNGGTLTTDGITVSSTNTNSNAIHFNGTQIVAVSSTNFSSNFFSGYKGNGDLDVASGGLNFNTNGKTFGIQQALSGVGALTKSGGGELDLYGANTYAGGTNISGGLLNVESGATLGSGAVDVQSGGALEFQDPSFSLTAAGLTLESGSQLWLSNDLTFDTLTIEGTNFAPGTYSYDQLEADYSDIFSQGAFGSITVLDAAAVPEPSSLALLGLGLGAGIFLHLRRRLFSGQRRLG